MTIFEIKDLTYTTLDRGLYSRDMVPAFTATVVFENGDWVGVSSYEDENVWIVDCAFRANGFPVFSNGTGSRITAGRTFGEKDAHIGKALDEAASILLEEMGSGIDTSPIF